MALHMEGRPHSASRHQVRQVSGMWGKRLKALIENWCLLVDEEFLLDCFRNRPGEQRFIGEHFGKYLDGVIAANVWEAHPELDKKIKYLVEEFVKTQEEDGYIGTYLPETRWQGRPHHLIPIENGWDPWVFKYSILALMHYHRLTGWQPALDVSKKAVDLLAKVFGPGGDYNLNHSDEHWGLASGSVLEAVMVVYRATGEKRYLDFATHIVKHYWEINASLQPRILPVLRHGWPIKDIGMGKAYEMISCFVGLLEYSRCTGETE